MERSSPLALAVLARGQVPPPAMAQQFSHSPPGPAPVLRGEPIPSNTQVLSVRVPRDSALLIWRPPCPSQGRASRLILARRIDPATCLASGSLSATNEWRCTAERDQSSLGRSRRLGKSGKKDEGVTSTGKIASMSWSILLSQLHRQSR